MCTIRRQQSIAYRDGALSPCSVKVVAGIISLSVPINLQDIPNDHIQYVRNGRSWNEIDKNRQCAHVNGEGRTNNQYLSLLLGPPS
jgi:hypothetical protein